MYKMKHNKTKIFFILFFCVYYYNYKCEQHWFYKHAARIFSNKQPDIFLPLYLPTY